MATFTMELHKVIAMQHDKGNGFRIGLDSYPLFDESYRVGLNRKIIEQYWNREIGLETVSLFIFALRRKMNQIMPLYNQVYKSTQIEFDPLATFNLETLRDDTGEETAESAASNITANSNGTTSRTTHLDTPQTELQNNEDYAASGDVARSDSGGTASANSTGNSTSATKASGKSTTKGFQGAASDLLLKYRSTLINTDMMIVNELSELFMQVWDNGEEFMPRGGFYSLGGFYV